MLVIKNKKSSKPVNKSVTTDTSKVVVDEIKKDYDPKKCWNCGHGLNIITSKYEDKNFCSIECYNMNVK